MAQFLIKSRSYLFHRHNWTKIIKLIELIRVIGVKILVYCILQNPKWVLISSVELESKLCENCIRNIVCGVIPQHIYKRIIQNYYANNKSFRKPSRQLSICTYPTQHQKQHMMRVLTFFQKFVRLKPSNIGMECTRIGNKYSRVQRLYVRYNSNKYTKQNAKFFNQQIAYRTKYTAALMNNKIKGRTQVVKT